jgi:hypothetical protein
MKKSTHIPQKNKTTLAFTRYYGKANISLCSYVFVNLLTHLMGSEFSIKAAQRVMEEINKKSDAQIPVDVLKEVIAATDEWFETHVLKHSTLYDSSTSSDTSIDAKKTMMTLGRR